MSAFNIGFYLNLLLFQSSFCPSFHTVQSECEMKYFEALVKYFLRGVKHLRQAKQAKQATNEKWEERARQQKYFKQEKELKHVRQGADEMSSPDKLSPQP